MQTAFETIRARHARFIIVKNNGDEVTFTVSGACADDNHGSATLKFFNPTHVWGAVWDGAAGEWRDLLGFALPEHGEINEAFVKPAGRRLKVSFTDGKTPLLRWGFTAESVESIAQA
jgi:hypothetical protein